MDAEVEKILREKYMCISAKLQTHQNRYQHSMKTPGEQTKKSL